MTTWFTDHPLLTAALLVALFLAAFIAFGVRALLSAKESDQGGLEERRRAEEAEAELKLKDVADHVRRIEFARIERMIQTRQAEIARRKKLKKRGWPVTPLRAEIMELRNRELQLAAQ